MVGISSTDALDFKIWSYLGLAIDPSLFFPYRYFVKAYVLVCVSDGLEDLIHLRSNIFRLSQEIIDGLLGHSMYKDPVWIYCKHEP